MKIELTKKQCTRAFKYGDLSTQALGRRLQTNVYATTISLSASMVLLGMALWYSDPVY